MQYFHKNCGGKVVAHQLVHDFMEIEELDLETGVYESGEVIQSHVVTEENFECYKCGKELELDEITGANALVTA